MTMPTDDETRMDSLYDDPNVVEAHAAMEQDFRPSSTPMHESSDVDLWSEATWNQPWEEPSNLHAPPPTVGMVQRWCRYEMLGQADPRNIAKKRQEGWVPRSLASVPKGYAAPTMQHGHHAGLIVVQGFILCEMPASRWAGREQHYADKLTKQREAIDRELEAAQAGPRGAGYGSIEVERATQVQTGATRRPVVPPD